ncbi:MAG: ribonucleoside-diphosphate reductase, adenosylcobalamin-dependent, partial [Halolamina sp.]
AWDKGEQIQSIPDAIGTAMRRYLDGEIDEAVPQQQTIDEVDEDAVDASTDGGAAAESLGEPTLDEPTNVDVGGEADGAAQDDATGDLIASGESPECPECGSMSLYFSEGCKTCESCGWSEC